MLGLHTVRLNLSTLRTVAKPEKTLWEPEPVALPELATVEAPDAVADAVALEEVDP